MEAEFVRNTFKKKKNCIIATFQCFCETGTVENRKHSGRPSKITEEKIGEAHHVTESQQQTSIRTVAKDCSIFRTTAHRVMTEYLSLNPYKVQFAQKLDEGDFQDRVEMYQSLILMLETRKFIFSDEATFYLHELINKHNIRHSCETNPRVAIESVMKSKLNT